MNRLRATAVIAGFGCLATLLVGVRCRPPKPQYLEPTRLYSIGDSITTAFDSWLVGDNDAVSWVNGFHGWWQDFLGVPDINAHNQRIDAAYGESGRTNVMAAENGARWDDALEQAQGIVAEAPTYVTVMLGGNDVCRDEIADLPTDEEIRGHVRATLQVLDRDLPAGATVLVVGIPDVKRLYDIGLTQGGLLGIDCEDIWATTALGFPCGSMLSPDNTEEDRLYVQSRNFAYNDIIALETSAWNAASNRVYFRFFDAESIPFTGDDISSIDCFHPSADGQELISALSWQVLPFGS
jgi:lysophospholipase L1-like esterase